MGRETALQKIQWIDGWPRLANQTMFPDLEVEAPSIAQNVIQKRDFSSSTDFTEETLPTYFKSLRQAIGHQFSLSARPDWLRIYGEQSISSLHRQSLIARRWQHFAFRAETLLDFSPKSFQQLAGLTLFYDTDNWHYLHVSWDEEKEQPYLQVEVADLNQMSYTSERIWLDKTRPVYLAVEVNYDQAQFYYALEPNQWQAIGEVLPTDHLSDD